MSQIHQKHINKYFPNRPILYLSGLGMVLGSVNAGILLSQLLYWHEKGKNKEGWVYKTVDELMCETGLTRTQQHTAIQVCRKYNILDYKLAGIPAKRHFRVNLKELENILPSLKEKAGIVYWNPPYKFAENSRSNTYSTHKTTTKNTSSKKGEASSIKQIINKKKYSSNIFNDFGK